MPGINMPADPAQPAMPALPQQLSGLGAGGYTIPQNRAPQMGPIQNASGPSFQPSPQGLSNSPAAQRYAANPMSPEFIGVDPAQFGYPPDNTVRPGPQTGSQTDMTGILAQLQGARDPQKFADQFNMLMKQRELVAKPQGIDARGGQIPSEDQEKYIKGEMDRTATVLTQPPELGGAGLTEYQARVQVAQEAKTKYPNIDPRYITYWASGAGPGDPKAGGGKPTTEGKPVEVGGQTIGFGADRAAKITPEKIANILKRPEFETAQTLAQEYLARAGGTPTASGFAQFVIDRNFAGKLARVQAARDAFDQAAANAAALAAQAEASPGSVSDVDISKAKLAAAQAKQVLTSIPYHGDKDAATAAAKKAAEQFFVDEAHVFSVAAALNNIY